MRKFYKERFYFTQHILNARKYFLNFLINIHFSEIREIIQSFIALLIMIHELPQVTDLNQYLYQYLIVVEQGSKKAVQLVL